MNANGFKDIDMALAVPFCNTFARGRDGKRRRCRHFSVEGYQFRFMGFPSVDSVIFRLSKRAYFRPKQMLALGFKPKRDHEGIITGWYLNTRIHQYGFLTDGLPVSVSFEWYQTFGTYLDISVKSLSRWHYGTSRKSFRDYRAYLYPLAMLKLLYKKVTGLRGADFGFDPFTDTIARLDIALNLVFSRKKDALAFIEFCKKVKIPNLKLTMPEDLPGTHDR